MYMYLNINKDGMDIGGAKYKVWSISQIKDYESRELTHWTTIQTRDHGAILSVIQWFWQLYAVTPPLRPGGRVTMSVIEHEKKKAIAHVWGLR